MIFKGKTSSSITQSKLGKLDVLRIKNQHCEASVSLFGGHVLGFKPRKDNRERLWLSDNIITDKSKPIRGGIPICWPWFANIFPTDQAEFQGNGNSANSDTPLPAHGFVRTQDWRVVSLSETAASTELILEPCELGKYGFPSSLKLRLQLSFSDVLEVKLISSLDNQEKVPAMTMALHTYLKINDIANTQLHGVNSDYIDKLNDDNINPAPSPYAFTQETDRIHLTSENSPLDGVTIATAAIESSTVESSTIESPYTDQQADKHTDNGPQTLQLSQSGHDSLVVWNPWIDKSALMSDMGVDAYKTMLCVEAAVVKPLVIGNNEHVLKQTIK
jgi:glucose-6-phosphate 1-epimerase